MELTKTIAKRFAWFKNVPYLPMLLDEQLKVYTLFFRPKTFQRMIRFTSFIKSLDGVIAKYHKYGGTEFRVNHKEICHMHGDGLVDILISRAMKDSLIKDLEIEPHHVFDDTGWVSVSLKNEQSYQDAIYVTQIAYNARTIRLYNN